MGYLSALEIISTAIKYRSQEHGLLSLKDLDLEPHISCETSESWFYLYNTHISKELRFLNNVYKEFAYNA